MKHFCPQDVVLAAVCCRIASYKSKVSELYYAHSAIV